MTKVGKDRYQLSSGRVFEPPFSIVGIRVDGDFDVHAGYDETALSQFDR